MDFLRSQGFTREKNAAKVWAVYEVENPPFGWWTVDPGPFGEIPRLVVGWLKRTKKNLQIFL